MSIQVNIFNSGSVPTATELANFVSELNTDLDSIVTLTTEQVIEGAKTFWGSKMLKFKQKVTADKLGFTFYDYQGKEVGNFEYDNKNNFRLLALGNYYSSANQEIEGHVGFKVYNKSALAAYRLLCPLAGNAKNSIPSLTDTYTNFYMPLVFTNGALSVTTDNNGKVDLSTLIGSGGSGDTSDLATVATTGDYNDLLNKPILFSGSYNDLTNKPTLFSGSYGDLTDKPTLFSGDYNDLTNKPTIPTVPTISTNIANDAISDTKTTSPKAVKDFVEGKGYLTQHQDISGKADQIDLEALEDRVETLEQGGSGSGDTTQYSYLKLIPDLDAYTEAPVGEIVKFVGQTNNKYTRGWDYECITAGSASTIVVPQSAQILDVADTNENTEFAAFITSAKKPFMHTGETIIFDKYQEAGEGTQYAGYVFPHGQTPQTGDYVYFNSSGLEPHLVLSNDGTNLVIQSKYSRITLQAQPTVQNDVTFYVFTNPDGIKLLSKVQNQTASPKKVKYGVLDYTNNIGYDSSNASGKAPTIVITFYSQSDTITYGSTPEWQPILMPTVSN